MSRFLILTKPGCTYCNQAKALLMQRNFTYSEKMHDTEEDVEDFKSQGFRTFPQIFDGGTHVGGFDQLKVYLNGVSDADDF